MLLLHLPELQDMLLDFTVEERKKEYSFRQFGSSRETAVLSPVATLAHLRNE